MAWVTVRHQETGGVTEIPDVPRVVASYQRRGWQVDAEQAATPEAPAGPPPAPAQPDTGDEQVASAEQSARRRRSE